MSNDAQQFYSQHSGLAAGRTKELQLTIPMLPCLNDVNPDSYQKQVKTKNTIVFSQARTETEQRTAARSKPKKLSFPFAFYKAPVGRSFFAQRLAIFNPYFSNKIGVCSG